jgi:hypothetical protein
VVFVFVVIYVFEKHNFLYILLNCFDELILKINFKNLKTVHKNSILYK